MTGQPNAQMGLAARAIAYLTPRSRLVRYAGLYRRFIRESGWAASARANAPVDRNGRPLPWYTYPAIAFLASRVPRSVTVFEYGSGNSTRWWASHAARVTAVEDDQSWFARVQPTLPANAEISLISSEDEYASAASSGGPYDVIVIDGSHRNRCVEYAVDALSSGGVIIWDNADWTHLFGEGLALLEGAGFRRVEFRGPGPLNGYEWTTTVLYRSGQNCLGL